MLLTHNGKIGQLISVPLSPASGTMPDLQVDTESSMLPPAHLEQKTVLGASTGARAEMSQLIAVQMAALLCRQAPEDKRSLLMGMTLPMNDAFWEDPQYEGERSTFFVDVLSLLASLATS
ncbi:hypothetical protein BCR37DRAFT_390529 [Protomyces lactucae-debilis]|uniref:Proteasome assembly chaperone 3 n=1 Tax=Protomyces lactucae-debilis TaxID=2754530 RepID=A0A1Y2FS62_PROLT|nr:uncharacterized protein BCR37DRAFT_390529 [Protomyces lactucae-debilis]ORY86789.1 hypothetical protein BCR37DRAFT_390529 [Protomyces lactucae-debilis]